MEKMTVDTAERLRAVIRELSPKSQAQFARMCNIQPASLSRLLSRQYRLTPMYVDRICANVEGLNRDYLLGKSEYMGDIADKPVDYVEELRKRDKRIVELEREVKRLNWLIDRVIAKEELVE